MKSVEFREAIREYELKQVIPFLRPGGRVLEIGAGAGWQARILAAHGFAVEAIDVKATQYKSIQIWPVRDYDGAVLPFPDKSFDSVFTSNTLEHIPNIVPLMKEMRRVLKVDGTAIHVLPTPSWRFWTTCTHYPYVPYFAREALTTLVQRRGAIGGDGNESTLSIVSGVFFPRRHGARGNALTELYSFSSRSWISLFEANGWRVKLSFPSQLFYSGHGLFGSAVGMTARRTLSRFLGSSCNIIILEYV
jgi:SAM-dependent methyltransferase